MQAAQKVELTPAPAATARPDLDKALETLRAHATGWARSSIGERIALAKKMLDGYVEVAEASVLAGCHAKGIDPSSPLASEEWFAGPTIVIRNLRLLVETLERLEAGRPPFDPARVRTRPDGRVVVEAFPASGLDKMLFAGFSAEVWLLTGTKAQQVTDKAAAHYRIPPEKREGKVSLVLGAGNVASIPPTDAIYKMFVEGKVCLIKMNPVNAHIGPFIEKAFKDAVDRGLVAVCYGGADVGTYLVEHPAVDEIHITGSDKTHDMMVWGPPGPERDARKAKKEPLLKKEITSELGNISPVIVVPGPYSDAELAFQGESITAAIANNASFNCNAAKLLVTPKGWDKADKLKQSVADALAKVPVRKAYYPGAEQRWNELVQSHNKVKRIGEAIPGTLPWAILEDIDPAGTDKVFSMEPWCSVLSETTIGSADPVAFLDEAVRFCNDKVWGTLSATIIVHPTTMKDPKFAEALDRAVQQLRYGTVCINHWPALGFAFGTTPWGGHPSATLEDIQSGKGWVHNTLMLEDIEKCVIRGPLVVKPKPTWFANHKTATEIGRKLLKLEAQPSYFKLPGIIMAALRG
ncbi:MAG TPA: aldehyde dehydrogenase family protein [Polyangia bacterium]|nr:aldehyde dehydrogenase family protein [Polyangia bacterium]